MEDHRCLYHILKEKYGFINQSGKNYYGIASTLIRYLISQNRVLLAMKMEKIGAGLEGN